MGKSSIERERNKIFEPVPIGRSNKYGMQPSKRCTRCQVNFPESKTQHHLENYHRKEQGFICEACPDSIMGSKSEIKCHIKKMHGSNGWIATVVVSVDENQARRVEQVLPDADSSGSSKSSATVTSSSDAKKGNLMKSVKDKQFLGPLKNQKTNQQLPSSNDRKRHDSSQSSPRITSSVPSSSTSSSSEGKREIKCEDVNSRLKFEPRALDTGTERGSNIFFCLFCDTTFDDEEKDRAVDHMKSHVEFGDWCRSCGAGPFKSKLEVTNHFNIESRGCKAIVKPDQLFRRNIEDWISHYFNHQINIFRSSFKEKILDKHQAGHRDLFVKCSICLKIADGMDLTKVVKFYDFKEFEQHFWNHTQYKKTICTMCHMRIPKTGVEKHFKHFKNTHGSIDDAPHHGVIESRDSVVDAMIENMIREARLEFNKKKSELQSSTGGKKKRTSSESDTSTGSKKSKLSLSSSKPKPAESDSDDCIILSSDEDDDVKPSEAKKSDDRKGMLYHNRSLTNNTVTHLLTGQNVTKSIETMSIDANPGTSGSKRRKDSCSDEDSDSKNCSTKTKMKVKKEKSIDDDRIEYHKPGPACFKREKANRENRGPSGGDSDDDRNARIEEIRSSLTPEMKYGCEECKKRFQSKKDIKLHMALKHTGVDCKIIKYKDS